MGKAEDSGSLIVVGARLNSSRLPRKHMLELAGVPMITRIFDRLAETGAKVVLATTADDFNRDLVRLARASGVPVVDYSGDVNDVVGRVNEVVAKYQPERVVYVCGDCPLVSQDYIRMALQALTDHPQWEQVVPQPGPRGETVIHEGILCLSRVGWEKLVALSRTSLEREHVGLGLAQGGPLEQGTIQDEPVFYGPRFRMSVDTAADWRFMDHLYTRWYASHQEPVSLKWVVDQVRTTSVGQVNAHVMQKSGYRSYGRALFITEASPAKGMGQLVRSVRLAERVCELAGLGVSLLILGESFPHACLRTVNHQWIGSESELWGNLAKAPLPPLIIMDLFPERLERPDGLKHAIVSLMDAGVTVIGLDRLWVLHKALSLVVVPCLVYRGVRAPNVVFGPQYALAPTWLPDSNPQRSDSVCLTVMTGGSDAVGYGEVLPGILDQVLPEAVRVRWLSGPYAIPPVLPARPRLEWELLEPRGDIASVASASSVVLSVYGNTVLELLANGIPVAILPAPGLIEDEEWQLLCETEGLVCVDATEEGLAPLRDLFLCEEARQCLLNRIEALGASGGLQRAADRILAALDSGH